MEWMKKIDWKIMIWCQFDVDVDYIDVNTLSVFSLPTSLHWTQSIYLFFLGELVLHFEMPNDLTEEAERESVRNSVKEKKLNQF